MAMFASFSSVMTYIGYIVLAIVVLLVMVLIHELGHYTAGKILKFKINEFSIGFGPKIFQKKRKNGELVSLRAFPLGGYCAFEGENESISGTNNKEATKQLEEDTGGKVYKEIMAKQPQSFASQKPWKRLIVLFFGAFFNFLSGIIFSFILLLAFGYDLVEVKQVNPTSINYNILQSGDVITGVSGNDIDFVNDNYFSKLVIDKVSEDQSFKFNENTEFEEFTQKDDKGAEKQYYMQRHLIWLDIKRGDENIQVLANVNVIYNSDKKLSGVSFLSTHDAIAEDEFGLENYKYSFGEALTQCVPFSFKWAWKILVVFGNLLTGKLAIKETLGGPVTTISTIASTARASASFLLVLMPVIAINLAVFNLLPIPALDGCQMLFTLIEWIRKKPINPKVVNAINTIGLLLLLGLVVVVDFMHFL